MAAEIIPLDLYVILVNYIFGSIWLSGIGILVALALIGIIGRMSPMLIIMIGILFVAIFITGYLGSIGAGLATLAGLIYAWVGIMNLINARQYYG